jgi:long-chain acyl-CoA synthetase
MKGYYENQSATDAVLREGWLHTGDLGRIDEEGNLYIVGRKKEMILGASGENVYPDELEEIYRDSEYVKELSVVGLAAGQGVETVAMLVVPDYEHDDLDRETIRERVREHVRATSQKLPLYKRVKVFHVWEHDLPKTSTRKIKRREVLEELERLEQLKSGGSTAGTTDGVRANTWVRDVVAQVTQKQRSSIALTNRLEELGFDSLMFTELGVALEGAGVVLPDPSALNEIETVAELEKFVATLETAKGQAKLVPSKDVVNDSDDIRVPKPFINVGRRGLRFGQRMLYERVFDTSVKGAAYIPPFGGYIVAANHSSHLDMGLVKHALGENGEQLVALAAKDYFFEDPVRRMYFENFTNLVPMERHGSLRESLRLAGQILREGYILLIFPEGTRSETGVMIDFKPSLGYLALANKCGILPMYLAGTYDGMPKGSLLPKPKDHALGAHAGPFYSYESLVAMGEGKSRAASYREIARQVETTVRAQAPTDYEWTLGDAGRLAVVDYEVRT